MAESEACLVLAEDEIHVWHAELDQPEATLRRLDEVLSPDERTRARRFCLERVRTRFIAGRGLLRTILGRYVGRAPESLRFIYAERGKPALSPVERADLRFNVSHSDGLGLFAVARGREVGVDVEQVRPLPRSERIAERFFSLPETTALKQIPAERRLEAFFTCWTRKEAYIKALGDGLAHRLDQFAVSIDPGEPARLSAAGDGDGQEIARWSLQAVPSRPGYVAALAGRGHGWRLATRPWPQRP